MMGPVNVLICDDSALIRKAVSQILGECRLVSIVGTAINGRFGLQKIDALKPDLVLLDIEMPEMNGIEVLKEVRLRKIDVPIIVFSSLARRGARITMEALALGAVDYVFKPSGIDSVALKKSVRQLLNQILIYGYRYKAAKTGNSEYLKLAQPIYDEENFSVFFASFRASAPYRTAPFDCHRDFHRRSQCIKENYSVYSGRYACSDCDCAAYAGRFYSRICEVAERNFEFDR